MNNRMIDSTLDALERNVKDITNVINKIKETRPPECMEYSVKRDFDEINSLSKRMSELAITGKHAVEIG